MGVLTAWVQYIAVGLAVGTTSGLLGVGGGIIMVPIIVLLWKTGPDGIKAAIATSLAVMIPTSLAGTWKHHISSGTVDFALAACLAIGSVVGTMYIGAPLANHLPAPLLKRIFGILMVISGLQWSGVFEAIGKLLPGNANGG